jgi:lipopolysaccharide transport system ATP-binding protein
LPAIDVRNVSKSYPLSNSQWNRFRHVFAGQAHPEKGIWALRDVSFRVERGEAFGVIGANGSGKSTLLQIIAGILRPTAGSVEVNGRLSALLELGSGFSPEFTGRQNVYMNASILGLSTEETDARFETIERFASIGSFIDQPIRTYSTGMVLRLAFAVVAHVDPEILIVDEALAVGDIAFRQRCMRRIHDLRAGGTTILFVSHETGDVKAFCERCIWLEKGVVRALGAADDVIGAYLSATVQREQKSDAEDRPHTSEVRQPSTEGTPPVDNTQLPVITHRYGNGHAEVRAAELTTPAGEPLQSWTGGAPAMLRLTFQVHAPLRAPLAGFLVRNTKGETIFGSNTTRENYPLPEMQPGELHRVDFHWVLPALTPGQYAVSVAVSDGGLEEFDVCDYVEDAVVIHASGVPERGYLRLRCSSVSVRRE